MGIANQADTLKEIKCSAGFSKKSYLLLENKTLSLQLKIHNLYT